MSEPTSFLDRRRCELMAGKQAVPVRYDDLRQAAREKLPTDAYEYAASGAGTGDTRKANRRALDRHRIVPRVLRDVSSIDISTRLFGRDLTAPLLLAPVGAQTIYHEEGELASARAAADIGVPFVLSTAASHSIETVAEAMESGPRLFQLYPHTDSRVTGSYLERAEAAGYDAVVLTVDSPVPRWVPDNLENGYRATNDARRAVQLSDPALEQLADERGCPTEALIAEEGLQKPRSTTWEDVTALRNQTDLPVVLKGIVDSGDAKRAVEYADGVVVSTHGGRQAGGQIGAAAALPDVVDAIDGRIPVLFDSGVRSGVDVFKALALGADAVLLGRPYVFGLALAGERGVREVVENCLAELESVLGGTGFDDVAAVDGDVLRERP